MNFAGAVVLRPEPGNARTAARLAALGVAARRCPLFAVTAVAWTPPDPSRFDALLLTSANAVRHAGPGLRALATLPVLAIGAATAMAAREAGLEVTLIGDADAAALLEQARARGLARLLHLAGRDRVSMEVDAVTVYATDTLPLDATTVRAWDGHIALLHSARAARRFATLVDRHRLDRTRIGVATLSAAVAAAVGEGWRYRAIAYRPDDCAMVTLAATLIDPPALSQDKQAR